MRGARPQILTPGKNRQVTVFGAIEMTTGAWVYRLGRHRAADFIAFLRMLAEAFPRRPGDHGDLRNDSIYHARAVTAHLEQHPGWSWSTAPATARTTTRSSASGRR